ncbi:MAG: DUF3160 domain-containing protein [Armatimonadota bacterium]
MASCSRRPLVVAMLCAVFILSAVFASAQQRPAAFRSSVTPSAPSYSLPVALNGTTNADALKKFTPQQRERLAAQGFVIIPDDAQQMFYLYEEYGTDTEEPIPNFITVDSMLHAYHLFFDFSLRTIETNHLYAALGRLTDLCLSQSASSAKHLPAGPAKDAALRNTAFFAIGKSLLTGKRAPTGLGQTADGLVAKEMALIAAHEGRAESPLLGTTVHYSQFIPRGHYTRSDVLRKYFMAMMWYGNLGFELDPAASEAIARRHTLQALLITRLLEGSEKARTLWTKIYEPTSFFVGTSDDLSYHQYASLAKSVFGAQLPAAAVANSAKLDEFLSKARKTFPAPQIAPYFLSANEAGELDMDSGKVQGRQFRFMGQRFIPDSYILQQLVSPLVKPVSPTDARDMPMGLDVMAALGSDRALDILQSTYNQGRYPQYREQMQKLRAQFAAKPESEWWRNLYWGWLYSFKALLTPFGEGYPAFMQGASWQDKELQTALGSWSQLRHDTILYGKPSGAEMGGGEEFQPKGYVEPVPEAFARLAYLTQLSQDGLQRRGLLDKSLAQPYANLKSILLFLKAAAEKELTGQLLSDEGYQRIHYFGGELERLQLSVVKNETEYRMSSWYEISSETDKNMPTIADVHTSFGQALEVGTGPAYRIYVVVPRPDGKLQITKGGVFSYFEFVWPVSDRLTDERWQQMLKGEKEEKPQQQEWLQSIVVGPKYPGYED